MALTDTQKKARDGKLTASQVGCLMSGDAEKILNLWRLHIGDPAYVEDNLDDVWAVQLGSTTEQLNLDWFARKHGPVTRRGEVVVKSFCAATLDGWSEEHDCPIECKHTGGFEKIDVIIQRYMPQIHWQMVTTESGSCALSVIMGAREPIVEFIQYDEAYGKELCDRALKFMECVRTMTPPVALPAVAAPVKAEKTYDYSKSNAWVSAAAQWLENREQAVKFDDAAKDLRAQVPADAQKVVGGKVVALRDKANRLKIVEEKK